MRLYHALHGRGVRVFRKEDGLERRDEIQKKLLEAVEDSAAAVVVISSDYASSHWCLEELAKICDVGRLILPVFYWVDPSHVRKQEGPFEDWFLRHAERFPKERVEQWKNAMKKVGGLAGFVLDEKRCMQHGASLIACSLLHDIARYMCIRTSFTYICMILQNLCHVMYGSFILFQKSFLFLWFN